MPIYYCTDLGQGRQLGATPADLFLFLKRKWIDVESFEAKFPQPNLNDHYVFSGVGVKITAQQREYSGLQSVHGNIKVLAGEISERQIKDAIIQFCLGPNSCADDPSAPTS